MGMGFSGVALWDGLSTAAFNPGGICFSRRSGVEIGSSWLRPATTFLEASPGIYVDSTIIPSLTPLFFNAVLHVSPTSEEKGLSLGLSVNQPFGTSVIWPDNWKGKFISQEFTLNTYFADITASIRLNKKVGIGIGGSYGAITMISRRALRDTDGQNLDVGSVSMSGSDLTWGILAGICLRPSDQLAISATAHSPMRVEMINGLADFSVPTSLENTYPDQSFRTSFWLPGRLDIGFNYRPESRLLLTAAINIVGWGMWDSLYYDLETPVNSLTQYPERGYRNSTSLRAGGEYSLSEKWLLRSGLYLENTPVTDQQLSPEVPDATSIGLTAGLGWMLNERFGLDLAYQFSFTGERSALLAPAKFGGTYESLLHSVGVSMKYQW